MLATQNNNAASACQKSDKAVVDTKKEVAKLAGVSHDTIAKVDSGEEIAQSAQVYVRIEIIRIYQ